MKLMSLFGQKCIFWSMDWFSLISVVDEQKLKNLMTLNVYISLWLLCVLSKKYLPAPKSWGYFLTFSSRRFIVVPFSSSSRMRLEWVRVCVVREGLKLSFPYCQLVPLLCVEKAVLCLLNCPGASVDSTCVNRFPHHWSVCLSFHYYHILFFTFRKSLVIKRVLSKSKLAYITNITSLIWYKCDTFSCFPM